MLLTHPASIQAFLDHLRYGKRASQHTVISYETDLVQFLHFVFERFDENSIDNVSASYIRSWLAQLKEDKASARTINRKISTLKSYYKFLLKKGIIIQTPMTTIISMKMKKRLPVFAEEKDTNELFQRIEFSDDWKGKTDRLILALLYNTGIRLSELINLKEKHIDESYSQLKVLGKGNKERLVPVSKQLMENIKNYISQKPETAKNTSEVLVMEKGKPLYPKYVYNTVKKYLNAVTTMEKKSPHVLRHTFATHLINNGADLNAIKELLGHASLAATQIYAHNTIGRLKEVHKQAHPKA